MVGKLVSALEKEKPSLIRPYVFHLYHRNECLRGEEMDMLESAKYCLEYGVSPETEAQPDVIEIDSERESLSSAKQRKILGVSLGFWKKQTYWSPNGKLPLRNPNWKVIAMTSFDFEDNPFRQIQKEVDQLQGQYSKLESVTKGAFKLLGDCKPGNIVKELKKLKQKDMGALEATNTTLSLQVVDLKVELSKKDEEIHQLKAQAEGLDQI